MAEVKYGGIVDRVGDDDGIYEEYGDIGARSPQAQVPHRSGPTEVQQHPTELEPEEDLYDTAYTDVPSALSKQLRRTQAILPTLSVTSMVQQQQPSCVVDRSSEGVNMYATFDDSSRNCQPSLVQGTQLHHSKSAPAVPPTRPGIPSYCSEDPMRPGTPTSCGSDASSESLYVEFAECSSNPCLSVLGKAHQLNHSASCTLARSAPADFFGEDNCMGIRYMYDWSTGETYPEVTHIPPRQPISLDKLDKCKVMELRSKKLLQGTSSLPSISNKNCKIADLGLKNKGFMDTTEKSKKAGHGGERRRFSFLKKKKTKTKADGGKFAMGGVSPLPLAGSPLCSFSMLDDIQTTTFKALHVNDDGLDSDRSPPVSVSSVAGCDKSPAPASQTQSPTSARKVLIRTKPQEELTATGRHLVQTASEQDCRVEVAGGSPGPERRLAHFFRSPVRRTRSALTCGEREEAQTSWNQLKTAAAEDLSSRNINMLCKWEHGQYMQSTFFPQSEQWRDEYTKVSKKGECSG